MRKKLIISSLVALLAVLLALWIWPSASEWLAVDSCLDRGGAWDAEAGECIFSD